MSKSLKLIYAFYKELALAPNKQNERSPFFPEKGKWRIPRGSLVSLFRSEIDTIMGKNPWIYTEYTKNNTYKII